MQPQPGTCTLTLQCALQLQEVAINSEAPDNYSPGLAAIPRPWSHLQACTVCVRVCVCVCVCVRACVLQVLLVAVAVPV